VRRWPVIVVVLVAVSAVVGVIPEHPRGAAGSPHSCGPAWKDVASPRIREGTLDGVVALSANDAWVVGGIVRYGLDWNVVSAKPLLEHWDGLRWTVVPAPVPVGNLYDITASGGDGVWAVGWQGRSRRSALVLHRSGGAWSVVAVPASLPVPSAVSTSGRDVWIVGDVSVGSTSYAEAWRFDGSGWTRSLRAKNAHVGDVVAVAADDVWAVGSSRDDHAEAFHWNGAAWRSFVLPRRASYDSAALLSVTAVAPDDVWVGGFQHLGEFRSNAGSPIVLRWNGRRWGSAPGIDGEYEVDGLAGLPSGPVLAVGTNDSDYWEGSGNGVFSAVWTRGRWRTTEVAGGRALYAVAAAPAAGGSGTLAWAVGQIGSGETDNGFPAHTVPLIRRYGC
jgi:hypothetical protein